MSKATASAPSRPRSAPPKTGGWTQMGQFPSTRYMGSKYKLLPFLWQHTKSLGAETVLDAFSGSACVGYLYKSQGMAVGTNDLLQYAYHIAKATIENDSVTLDEKDLGMLMGLKVDTDGFIRTMFKDLYFTEEENLFLEQVWHRIHLLDDPYKQSLALSALCRACIKKRPRGVFTYTGARYDDGRLDLRTSIQDHFTAAVKAFNAAVFSNGRPCRASCGNIFDHDRTDYDMVYIDPPYFSTQSDNDYLRRYHFVEGLCSYWKEAEIQLETRTKKLKKVKTSFDSKDGIHDAFHRLFAQYPNSTLAVSYSSNCLPTKPEMLKILKQYRPHVSVKESEHFYSFGNQGNKVDDNRNAVTEYLFIASFQK